MADRPNRSCWTCLVIRSIPVGKQPDSEVGHVEEPPFTKGGSGPSSILSCLRSAGIPRYFQCLPQRAQASCSSGEKGPTRVAHHS